MTKIEQVAAAIEDLVAAWSREEADTVDIARAAIEAMREPGNDALQAMFEAMFEAKFNGSELPMLGAGWEAGVDHILNEQTA